MSTTVPQRIARRVMGFLQALRALSSRNLLAGRRRAAFDRSTMGVAVPRWVKRDARRVLRVLHPVLALSARTLLPAIYREVQRTIVRHSSRRDRRIARTCHGLLQRIGHPILGYKICLATEAQFLHRDEGGPGARFPSHVSRPPVVDQIVHFLLATLVNHLIDVIYLLRGMVRLITPRPLQRTKPAQSSPGHQPVAGVFEGLSYRMVKPSDSADLIAFSFLPPQDSPYESTTRQALDLKKCLQRIRAGGEEDIDANTQIARHDDRIGIIVSCYHPDAYLEGFLANLRELVNPERLVPIIVNAGMSAEAEKMIRTTLDAIDFHQSHFLPALGSGIYEAWNVAIDAVGDSVRYLTNFNVDDRRHPLCMEIQADALMTFPDRQFVVTDYLYFFAPRISIVELYDQSFASSTRIPVVNKRTILYRNLPHSSPMWRQSLHQSSDCGMFDASYRSAGDADFWYRVCRRHESPAEVVSIPLSLYYNNPDGLSTRLSTAGEWEHKICSDPHYLHLMDEIDNELSEAFVAAHCHRADAEYLQLFAALSALRES